ncbi:hypothetical protein BGZ63DRAFT_394638 [Mariannaea sp. PMI_226]|nr:hypothetical protein BGZ63DRAFT_394638 [Mariannaea sp. PMI_226]
MPFIKGSFVDAPDIERPDPNGDQAYECGAIEMHNGYDSFQGRGARRKQVALWTCCICGCSAMTMRVDPCRYCSTPRCMYCPVSKVKM